MNESSKNFSCRSWIWHLLIYVFVAALLVAMAIPNFVGSHTSKINGIINNLRQIDAAKNEWAVEHGVTNLDQIARLTNQLSAKDITPYLHFQNYQGVLVPSVAGETYAIGALNKSPEAKLVHKIYSYPTGSIIRFSNSTNLFPFELILPDGTKLNNF
jgi:hypothetical protein